jgi:glycosyltransferase involved in cell wall biosynthesis
MSTDRSRAIAAERSSRFPCIRILTNERKIVSCGLNVGIRQARGQVIIIMGAHAEYPPSYISNCIAELERTDADVVGGVLETRPGANTVIARAVALMSQHPFGVGRSAFRTRQAEGYVDTVPYGAYRREVFEAVGWFNEQLVRNQDFEFNARVRKAGGQLFLSRDLEVVYYNVPDFRHLARQAFRNGFWVAEMWRVSPLSFRMRHAIPLIFVLVLLVSAILAPFSASAAEIAGLTMAIYGLAAAVAAAQIAVRAGVQFFFPLIALFFAHHVLYGLGTFAGVPSGLRLSLRQHKARLTGAASG